MLKWAKHRVQNKTYNDKHDAKIEFRCCMDRLTRDLKLYRISPQDLIKVSLPNTKFLMGTTKIPLDR